jgi:primosomal protein N' (replication factor Y) (superfamily II helicase)
VGKHRSSRRFALDRRSVLTEQPDPAPGQRIAQVRVDVSVPHLDRPFDYLIPVDLTDRVVPGVRVRVRFAGRLVNGYVTSVSDSSDHGKELKEINRVISDVVVLRPTYLEFVESVAHHFGGTVHDVLRFAIPARHARAEAASSRPALDPRELPDDVWQQYESGQAMVHRCRQGQRVRAVWSSAPASSWSLEVATLAHALRREGGVIVVVPDAADAHRLHALLPEASIFLADQGPERRYREFLRVLRGEVSLVIGTRNAVFAPFEKLDGIIVWGDGEDSLWEQQAPYWNARDVAAIRSHRDDCSLIVGSPARSTQTQSWCDAGWAVSITASKETIAAHAPKVKGIDVGDDAQDGAAYHTRMPHQAWKIIKDSLPHGPILVQVARRGYVPRLACQQCRTPVDCPCGGPLQLTSGHAVPTCQWCGALAGGVRCPSCGSQRLRAMSVGAERTAEEFGRAFPDTPIIWSAGAHIVRDVDATSAIVVATQGAEPVATGGYAAVVILDGYASVHRVGLRVLEDAAHRWFGAAVLARSRAPIFVSAPHGDPIVQALVRWQAPWFAEREITERAAAHMPPATRMIVLRGEHPDIAEVVQELGPDVRILGPVDGRAIALPERTKAAGVIDQLRAITARRSANRKAGVVTVIVDPREP